MNSPKKRPVSVVPSPGVKEAFRKLKKLHPEIRDAIKIFNKNKRSIPPTPLPVEMKDHALKGALKGIRECHLDGRAGDILLLYTHENDVIRMLAICRHAELHHKKSSQLKKRTTKNTAA